MKDHEIAQFVNELTAVAKSFGQTQQLRDRLSEVVHRRLEHGRYAPKTMQLATSCVGKVCACPRGSCAEAAACPEDVVTVFVPTGKTAAPAQEEVKTAEGGMDTRRWHLQLRQVVPQLAGVEESGLTPNPRRIADGMQFCATEKDA